jgi:hypothetical protein|tara:strand:+ start:1225 stop:1335 length:111 start_codon:yes stop_codon:yes gene_type:complete
MNINQPPFGELLIAGETCEGLNLWSFNDRRVADYEL